MDFILTGIVFIPLVAAIVIMVMKVTGDNNGKVVGIATMASLLTFVGAIALLVMFDSHHHGMQFVQSVEWVPMLHIYYSVGVDGISLWLVVLTALLGVLSPYIFRVVRRKTCNTSSRCFWCLKVEHWAFLKRWIPFCFMCSGS